MLCEKWKVLQVLPAGVGGVELGQFTKHNPPRLHLVRRVFDTGNWLSTVAWGDERDNNIRDMHKWAPTDFALPGGAAIASCELGSLLQYILHRPGCFPLLWSKSIGWLYPLKPLWSVVFFLFLPLT